MTHNSHTNKWLRKKNETETKIFKDFEEYFENETKQFHYHQR